MTPIPTIVQPELVAPAPVNQNTGTTARPTQGEGEANSPQPFASVLAHAQTGGKTGSSTANSATRLNSHSPQDGKEGDGADSSTEDLEGLLITGLPVSSLGTPSPSGLSVTLEKKNDQPIQTLSVRNLKGDYPTTFSSSHVSAENSQTALHPHSLVPASHSARQEPITGSQKAHLRNINPEAQKLIQKLNGDPGMAIPELSSSKNIVLEKTSAVLTGLPRDGSLPARIEDSLLEGRNSQARTNTGILSFDGVSRQSQAVLNSPGIRVIPANGIRPGGVEEQQIGRGVPRLNGSLENSLTLKSEGEVAIARMDDSGSQDFGLDGEESQSKDSFLSQQRSLSPTSSGSPRMFSDSLGEVSGKEGVLGSRLTGGERLPLPPTLLPQRLQMDVTLADDARVQIEVAVQQRQVAAQVLTDQSALRSLVLQNEGQLVGQLAEAGLELKQFGAHNFDHSPFSHRETPDQSSGGAFPAADQEGVADSPIQERMSGLRTERGMHLVA